MKAIFRETEWNNMEHLPPEENKILLELINLQVMTTGIGDDARVINDETKKKDGNFFMMFLRNWDDSLHAFNKRRAMTYSMITEYDHCQ